MTGSRDEFTDLAFEEDVRALLHRAADPVQPDPAGWHRLQRRIHRRRTAVRTGTFALAGAAAAVVAVAVISTGPDTADVELGPGGLATQPPAVTATATPTPGLAPSTRPAPSDEAGAILHTDGRWLRMTSLDGAETTDLFPAPPGRRIADVAVHPASTTSRFDLAYRDVPADGCASTHVTAVDTRPGGALTSGTPVGDAGLEEPWCTDAPTFSGDGSRLAWFAHRGDTDLVLQSIEWDGADPGDPIVHTTPLAPGPLEAVEDPHLIALSLPAGGAESGTLGTLLVRSGAAGQLLSVPVDIEAGGALSVDGAAAEPVTLDGVGGQVVDADGRWRAVVLPTGDAEPLLGLAYAADDRTLTAESPLFADPFGTPHLDAVGDTAIVGLGPIGGSGSDATTPSAVILARVTGGSAAPTGIELVTDLPAATSAVLLPDPEIDPDTPAVPATPGAAATPTEVGTAVPASPNPAPVPTATPTPTPTSTATPPPPSAEVPDPVQDVAMAIRDAAVSRDWDRVGALIPDSGFTSNYGGETDHVAFYRQEEANGIDVLGTLAGLLAEDPVRTDQGIWVWPDEYATGEHLGYRVGITDAGTWIFYVAGD